MAIVGQAPIGGVLREIDCNVEGSAKAGWTCCQLLQFCAKLDEANNQAADSEHSEIDDDEYEERRAEGNDAAADFREAWNNLAPQLMDEALQPRIREMFYHPCAYDEAHDNNLQVGPEMQPDHEHEIQLGGAAADFVNLRWIDTSVNRSLGSSLTAYDPAVHTGGVSADCCPAEETYCAGKTPDQGVL